MKQLFAAGPLAAAPTLTAASAGLTADAVTAALGSANYAPPSRGDRLPVRLALLNTPHAGRVLAHTAPAAGRYFAHALLNVPATADAQTAIQTWGSPHWQRHAPDTAADLPELPYLPVADVLDDAALKAWLDAPAHRELLEFTLHALLGTPPHARIVLAAAAEDVAEVVYAVTRALPPGLLDEFTFSTYEPDPLACSARLVGHDTGDPAAELPDGCYAGDCVGFNPATGRRSAIPGEVPFASYAAATFAAGQFDKLDAVKETWQKLGLRDGRHFDLVFRLTRGTGVLSKEESAEALALPAVAAWIAGRADAMNQFVEWAVEDRAFATGSFGRAVQPLRQKPDAVARLSQSVREHATKAIAAGDLVRAANALEVVLPTVAPAKANAVWGELLSQTADPNALSWPARWYLLPRCVRFKQPQSPGVDPAFARWLDVPTDRLGDLLALDLPRAYHLQAARTALARDGEPTALLAKTLAAHPKLTLAVLAPEGGVTADRAVALYRTLLAEAAAHPWLEDVLAAAATFPRELLNRFFEASLEAGTVDADRVIRAQGPALLELFAGQSGLDRLGTRFLANPPADLLHAPAVLLFLAKLRAEPGLSAELAGRIDAVKAVRGYLDGPAFTAEAMTPVAAALAVAPPTLPATARAEVFDAVAAGLLRRSAAGTVQDDLEAALIHLGAAVATGPADLYENLLRDLRGRTDLGRDATLVHAFLAVALGATRSAELAGKLDGLDGHAFAVASDAANRGGNRLLDEIDRRAASWAKEARTKWGFLLAAVRPQRRLRRDALCAAVGALVATLAWWAVRLVG